MAGDTKGSWRSKEDFLLVGARWENGSIVHDILPGFKRFVLSYPPFTKKNEKMPIKVFEVDVSVYEGIL